MKSISRFILILIIPIIISGCFWKKDEIKPTIIVQHKTICINPPKSTKIFMRKVDPMAVKDDLGVYWVGITPQHYENQSLNIDDMLGGIKQKNAIIEYYQKCIAENSNDSKVKPK